MHLQDSVRQNVGVPVSAPQFAGQCEGIRKIIQQLREKLVFVSVRNTGEKTEKLRGGHINEELEDIQTQLKDLLDSIQY